MERSWPEFSNRIVANGRLGIKTARERHGFPQYFDDFGSFSIASRFSK